VDNVALSISLLVMVPPDGQVRLNLVPVDAVVDPAHFTDLLVTIRFPLANPQPDFAPCATDGRFDLISQPPAVSQKIYFKVHGASG